MLCHIDVYLEINWSDLPSNERKVTLTHTLAPYYKSDVKHRNTIGCLDQYTAQNIEYARPYSHPTPKPKNVFFKWHTQNSPPWNSRTVKQSTPRAVPMYGCFLNWITSSPNLQVTSHRWGDLKACDGLTKYIKKGAKPLPKICWSSSQTHICGTRRRWVNEVSVVLNFVVSYC